jgi:HSP20 family molecular chaperone IbpA
MAGSKNQSNTVKIHAKPVRTDLDEETFTPLVDVYEEPDGTTVLVAEIPGAPQETVDIRVDKGVLTIAADGRRAETDEDYLPTYTGFAGGQYFRAFVLSDEVDRDRIAASLDDGVLTVRLPRAAAAETRRIPITEGESKRKEHE